LLFTSFHKIFTFYGFHSLDYIPPSDARRYCCLQN
jgi:hypothetical protein